MAMSQNDTQQDDTQYITLNCDPQYKRTSEWFMTLHSECRYAGHAECSQFIMMLGIIMLSVEWVLFMLFFIILSAIFMLSVYFNPWGVSDQN